MNIYHHTDRSVTDISKLRCDQAELTDTGRKIRDAFDGLTSVCPELNGQGE